MIASSPAIPVCSGTSNSLGDGSGLEAGVGVRLAVTVGLPVPPSSQQPAMPAAASTAPAIGHKQCLNPSPHSRFDQRVSSFGRLPPLVLRREVLRGSRPAPPPVPPPPRLFRL